MKVLMTGHNGFLGSVMQRVVRAAGHDVVGLDSYLFGVCSFGAPDQDIPSIRVDLRDVQPEHLEGFDAVIHLAALSNDPLGNLNADLTYDVNHRASVRLATMAKAVGVPRFLFASSCSLYGVAGTDDPLTEEAAFNPVTPYGTSKILVEQDVRKLADDNFSPTYLRNATAYGVSPRLRADLVVNSLVGYAVATGQILMQSDGTPWRPLVHAEDIARAFVAVLHAPRDLVHNEAFNVGRTQENYRISEIAEMVREVVPDSRVTYAPGGGPDARCYRVDCTKIAERLPEFKPQWTVRRGVEELYQAYTLHGLELADLEGPRYLRMKRIQKLLNEKSLDENLRWREGSLGAARRLDRVDANATVTVP
jgi:nucleoside-diphosphate-sugar epimerase